MSNFLMYFPIRNRYQFMAPYTLPYKYLYIYIYTHIYICIIPQFKTKQT